MKHERLARRRQTFGRTPPFQRFMEAYPMKWNLVLASLVASFALCNQSFGFELLDRLMGGGGGCGGCSGGCCSTPSQGGCLSGSCGCGAADDCGCCAPKCRSYHCIKLCLPKINIPLPKITITKKCCCMVPACDGCSGGCASGVNGGVNGYVPQGQLPMGTITDHEQATPVPPAPIVDPSAFVPRRTKVEQVSTVLVP